MAAAALVLVRMLFNYKDIAVGPFQLVSIPGYNGEDIEFGRPLVFRNPSAQDRS